MEVILGEFTSFAISKAAKASNTDPRERASNIWSREAPLKALRSGHLRKSSRLGFSSEDHSGAGHAAFTNLTVYRRKQLCTAQSARTFLRFGSVIYFRLQ